MKRLEIGQILMVTLVVWLTSFTVSHAQQTEVVQAIAGKVVDRDTQLPLIGATIILSSDTNNFVGTTTDTLGHFELPGLSIGRHQVLCKFIGYKSQYVYDVVTNASRKTWIEIALAEASTELAEVEIVASQEAGAINEMAIISSQVFTVEETERFPGTRGDVGRMVSSFAGVTGANDSNNDAVVRGNTPAAISWRLEGVPIANPNHYGVVGTSGGGSQMINNKTLASSDFYLSAYPAEFGNSIGGVFDLKLRNGNSAQHNWGFTLGLFGTEITGEGPINKEKRSSYLVNYRYSTFELFSFAGINIGTTATPKYQDVQFKLFFPQKNGGSFSVFGLGGMSSVFFDNAADSTFRKDLFTSTSYNKQVEASSGVVGASYTHPTKNGYLKAVVSTSTGRYMFTWDKIFRHLETDAEHYTLDSMKYFRINDIRQNLSAANLTYLTKPKKGLVFKAGVNNTLYQFNFYADEDLASTGNLVKTLDATATNALVEPFAQAKVRLSGRLSANLGLRSVYYSQNNFVSPVEPRAGINYTLNAKQKLVLGYGLHSMLLAPHTNFVQRRSSDGAYEQHNAHLDPIRSHHMVFSYSNSLTKTLQLKMEAYYQHLFNIPVVEGTYFSAVNTGMAYTLDGFVEQMENTGIGRNYGLDFTLNKYYAKTYFFAITGTVFRSLYTDGNNIERPTTQDRKYLVNLIALKDFKLGKKSMLSVGVKYSHGGGAVYSPYDLERTKALQEIAPIEELYNSEQFPDYSRLDLQLKFRLNGKKLAHTIAFDIANVLSAQNALTYRYQENIEDPSADPVVLTYQLPFLPVFYYRVEF